mmetsp:Transcript_37687/g.82772  ORF Transcript_37687/g.82772 Transcript_37687/m.82772 type:complete len:215 (+) Transcript_37687:1098-1742(+)
MPLGKYSAADLADEECGQEVDRDRHLRRAEEVRCALRKRCGGPVADQPARTLQPRHNSRVAAQLLTALGNHKDHRAEHWCKGHCGQRGLESLLPSARPIGTQGPHGGQADLNHEEDCSHSIDCPPEPVLRLLPRQTHADLLSIGGWVAEDGLRAHHISLDLTDGAPESGGSKDDFAVAEAAVVLQGTLANLRRPVAPAARQTLPSAVDFVIYVL